MAYISLYNNCKTESAALQGSNVGTKTKNNNPVQPLLTQRTL